jgi:hypothetical protein
VTRIHYNICYKRTSKQNDGQKLIAREVLAADSHKYHGWFVVTEEIYEEPPGGVKTESDPEGMTIESLMPFAPENESQNRKSGN